MATTSFSNVSIPVGSRTFGPVAVPDNLHTVKIAFSNWAQAGRTLSCFVEQSDDAINWIGLAAMNATPGARSVSSRSGNANCGLQFDLEPDTSRLLRVTAVVAGGTVTTTVTITTS